MWKHFIPVIKGLCEVFHEKQKIACEWQKLNAQYKQLQEEQRKLRSEQIQFENEQRECERKKLAFVNEKKFFLKEKEEFERDKKIINQDIDEVDDEGILPNETENNTYSLWGKYAVQANFQENESNKVDPRKPTILDLLDQQEEIAFDSERKRWKKCEKCGIKRRVDPHFTDYESPLGQNIGLCKECAENNNND